MPSKKENRMDDLNRKTATENPWYVLATLFGEDISDETTNKNRQYWI